MRWVALATDYDGTLAEDGKVRDDVLRTLLRFKESGRKLVLVTGRQLDDLEVVFAGVDIFDRVVAENGAVLSTPGSASAEPSVRLLAVAPPPELAAALRARGVAPLSCGHVIVATREPHEHTVLEVIRELGVELEVILNKGAVMVLPTGVNKATGLLAALEELGVDPSRVAGVGDAENDHSLLDACGLGAAVANALPVLKARADVVTLGARGQGVMDLCERLMSEGEGGTASAHV